MTKSDYQLCIEFLQAYVQYLDEDGIPGPGGQGAYGRACGSVKRLAKDLWNIRGDNEKQGLTQLVDDILKLNHPSGSMQG